MLLLFRFHVERKHRYVYSKTEGNIFLSSERTKRQRRRNEIRFEMGMYGREIKGMNATFSHTIHQIK